MDNLRQAHAVPSTMKAANLREIEALNPNVSSTDVLSFSGRDAPVMHHYRVYCGGSPHVSLRASCMIKLRAFTVQAEAAGRWARHGESARPNAVRQACVQPRDICRRDSDFDLLRSKTRREVSPRKPDAPTVRVLSSVTSSLSSRVDIYDGRPPILPVSIRAPVIPTVIATVVPTGPRLITVCIAIVRYPCCA